MRLPSVGLSSKDVSKIRRTRGSGWSSELIHLILRLVLAPAQ